ELGHALFTSLVIVGVDKTHTICLSLQAQRGFFFFCVVDRGRPDSAYCVRPAAMRKHLQKLQAS
ncbi:MAG: hypothetical protein LBU06_07300, partial [Desulfovibrio sp.]|nr:hypothetical protein [Desulfovibrio sp.]